MRLSRVSRAGEAPKGKGLVCVVAPSQFASLGLDSTALPCNQVIWDPAVAHSPHPTCLEPGSPGERCPSACNRKQGINSMPCFAGMHGLCFHYYTHPSPPVSSHLCSSSCKGRSSGRRKPHQAPAVPVARLEVAGQRVAVLTRPGCHTRATPCPAPAESGATPAGTWKILASAHLAEPQLCSWPGFPLPIRTPHPRQAPVLGAGAPQGWEQNRILPSPHQHRAPAKTPHS